MVAGMVARGGFAGYIEGSSPFLPDLKICENALRLAYSI